MVTAPPRRSRRNAPRGPGSRQSRSESGTHLTVRVWKDDRAAVFLAVPRRLGTAVERNRLRRQLREVSRRRAALAGHSILVSVSARPSSFQDLEAEYDLLLSRLGALGG